VTDRLRSYGSAMKTLGMVARQQCGRWLMQGREFTPAVPTKRRPNSGTSRPCNSLPPFTPRSTTTFTKIATSAAAASSSITARSLWPSGVSLPPERFGFGRFGDQFAFRLTAPLDGTGQVVRALTPRQHRSSVRPPLRRPTSARPEPDRSRTPRGPHCRTGRYAGAMPAPPQRQQRESGTCRPGETEQASRTRPRGQCRD
jgi:hypothetical protein